VIGRLLLAGRTVPIGRILVVGGVLAVVPIVAPAATRPDTGPEPLTLGLFLPRSGPQAEAGREATRGAAIAVDRANRERSAGGRTVRLVEAPSDGAWSTGTRGLARLIHDDKAFAVIGGFDGRSAHVAEQVIVRARGAAVFLTPWASGTTLTALRIPWYFSLVPDDRRQADRLVAEIYSVRRIGRVALWPDDGPDGQAAAAAFVAAAPAGSTTRLDRQQEDPRPTDPVALLRSTRAGALVLFGDPVAAGRRARRMVAAGAGIPIFGPLALACEEFRRAAGEAAGRLIVITPDSAADFAAEYRARHGTGPSAIAMYTHDAVAVAVAAARRVDRAAPRAAAGPTAPADAGARPAIAAALARVEIDGATGPVAFDRQRARLQVPDPRPLWAIPGGVGDGAR
jgi:branched-chain amino acid transport system substrate-binding protein